MKIERFEDIEPSYFCTGWTVEGLLKKMNIEHPTSNVEWEKMKKQT
jgi:hypothetical protein